MADEFDELTKDELRDRAREAGLAVTGSKEELQERLRDRQSGADRRAKPGSASEAISVARRGLSETIGVEIESVTGARRDTDGDEWTVQVQTIESRRIPPSGDVISLFDVTVSGDEMVGFERIKRGRRDTLDIA